ncbi:MAG TPA: ABC transporter permease [Tepidisphaeraceae bacterium]
MQALFRTSRTAVRALHRNIGRSALTCLGIIIGIAAVIAMVEIGQGTTRALEDTISRIGANVINIDPSDAVKAGVSSGAGSRVTLIPDDAYAILREVPGIRWAAPAVDLRTQVVAGNKNTNPWRILGTTPQYMLIRRWEVSTGDLFTDNDVKSGNRACILGQTVATELFGDDDPIGKEVRISNVSLKVVGVLAKKGSNVMGFDQDNIVVAPWTTVKFRLSSAREAANTTSTETASSINTLNNLYPSQSVQLYPDQSPAQLANWPRITRFTDVDDIYLSVETREQIPEVMRHVTLLLRQRHRLADGDSDDFRIRDLTEMGETVADSTRMMATLLLTVATISLIVGGVGIMNIMLVSVTERTREIGLRMAVGARPRDVLRQFLIEAVILCLAGGIAGIALGRGASVLITHFLRWPTLTSLPAIVAALTVSVTVGVLFGYYPAWRASRLDPIEALRSE